MSGGQDKKRQDGFDAEGLSRRYIRLSIVLFTAILAAAFLHYHIAEKQNKMLLVTYLVEQQGALANSIAAGVSRHYREDDDALLEQIRADAAAAQKIEPMILPLTGPHPARPDCEVLAPQSFYAT